MRFPSLPLPPPLPLRPESMVYLTKADEIVLQNLSRDIRTHTQLGEKEGCEHAAVSSGKPADADHTASKTADDDHDRTDDDESSIQLLAKLAEQPTVFTIWDLDLLNDSFNTYLVQPYIAWASTIVRRPADIVFLTHLLLYSSTIPLSAAYLFYSFSWTHGIFHTIFTLWCAGAFTLLMHNHIHNSGLLVKEYSWVDWLFPYVLGPFLGHTWDSYYYHHVKHHHVESNGPGDLSSTIQYQRDRVVDFLKYEARFLALAWIELPLYFMRKRHYTTGLKSLLTECSSLFMIFTIARLNFRPALFTFVLPLSLMRIGMMIGNWGQHCLVDEVDPNSDFRSSITLIDEAVSSYGPRAKPYLSNYPTEQPALFQRWLSHLSPPERTSSLV